MYTLHRISSVTPTKEPAVRPKDFSLDAFLAAGGMQFGEGPQIRLKAVVTTNLANYLQERPLSPEQKVKPIDKGHYRFEVMVKDSWQLGFWILSQGDEIVIEQPAMLRDRIKGIAQDVLIGYGVTPDIGVTPSSSNTASLNATDVPRQGCCAPIRRTRRPLNG